MAKYSEQIHRCFRCGWCKFTADYRDINCPSYKRFRLDTYSTSGRLWLIRSWLNGEIKWSERLGEILYTCTTCKNCVEQCPMGFAPDIVDWIVQARTDVVEAGQIPPRVARFLEGVYGYGNPFKSLRSERAAWADGVKKYAKGDEYLFYVGCLGSYDENGQKMARSLANIMQKCGMSFGILGNDEECCGNEVYLLGETGLFQLLVEKNIKTFQDLSVKKIVTLSPHAYNIMKNVYPISGANFEIYHYTQILHKLIADGLLTLPSKKNKKNKITYQDPCFLGRYNYIYDEPRQVLSSIPDIQIVEMPRSRKDAFCCGGGSGSFATDLLAGSEDSPSRVRVREAHKTGASILTVACPGCMAMLTDAVKAENLDDKIAVKDISQIVMESMK